MVALVATTVFAACGSDDDDSGGNTTVSGLKLNKTSVTFTNTGGEETVSAQANVQASASSDAAWCTVTTGTMSQNLKVTPITIKVAAMTTETADRTATITVKAGSESAVISVTQTAGDVLTVSQTEYEVGAEGGTITVKVTSNGDYKVASDAAWLTVGAKGNGEQSFTASANPAGSRTATITFTLNKVTATVKVIQAAGKQGSISASAADIAKQMYPGWNLGNTLEPPGSSLGAETSWQPTKTTQQIIDYVKSLGFKSVRIPCSWDCHATNGTIDAQWMARVKEVVDYCISDGLYVLLNDHWDNGWIQENGFTNLAESNVSAKLSNLQNLWTQIATEFCDYDEHLLFAGLNEPDCDSQAKTDVLIRYEQGFIEAVRATGGNNAKRTLVVQGPSTDIDKTNNLYDVTKFSDPAGSGYLMVEVHYYTPWNFCGMEKDESWGKMFWYWGADNHVSGSSYNASWGEVADMQTLFKKMKTKFADKGYPVLLGEYGCQWRNVSSKSGESQEKHDASVKLFHKSVCQYAPANGMIPFVWDINSTSQGGTKGVMTVINRSNLSVFCSPAMEGITEGVAAATWPY